MRVRLLQTIRDGTGVKTSVREGRDPAAVAHVEGAVVDVSDATGEKWIDRGWAKEVLPEDDRDDEHDAEPEPPPPPAPKGRARR